MSTLNDLVIGHLLMDKMMIHLDMLGALIKIMILCNMNVALLSQYNTRDEGRR